MEYLDPKKKLRDKILLLTGYVLITIAIVIATVVLVYESYGYGINQNGQVIQNGLIFLSSQPNPASIFVNNSYKGTTNTNLTLQSGIYNFTISLNGFRTWNRKIEIDGGTISYYEYPLLIPNVLKPKTIFSYTSAPALATESLNQNYLLVLEPNSNNVFDLYQLNNTKITSTNVTLPASIVSPSTGSQSWKVIGWANDNKHILLEHIYSGNSVEYILFDVNNPSNSINLSKLFTGLQFTSINFVNQNYQNYYLYNSTTQTLQEVNINTPSTPTTVLSNVISYDSYLNNIILYATSYQASVGEVNIDELDGSTTYHIRSFPSGGNYLMDMASYNGVIYVGIGDSNQNKVYVYQDPVNQIQNSSFHVPIPAQVLYVNHPTYMNFSTTAQFIMAEGGNSFGVFDIANQHGYNYITKLPIDPPQTNATWMGGDRLTYVSGGKLIMFEYDHNYRQILVNASPNYLPFFPSNYQSLIVLAPNPKNGHYDLTQTSLINP